MVKYKEVFRIYKIIFGPDHLETLEVSNMLFMIPQILESGITGYSAELEENHKNNPGMRNHTFT